MMHRSKDVPIVRSCKPDLTSSDDGAAPELHILKRATQLYVTYVPPILAMLKHSA